MEFADLSPQQYQSLMEWTADHPELARVDPKKRLKAFAKEQGITEPVHVEASDDRRECPIVTSTVVIEAGTINAHRIPGPIVAVITEHFRPGLRRAGYAWQSYIFEVDGEFGNTDYLIREVLQKRFPERHTPQVWENIVSGVLRALDFRVRTPRKSGLYKGLGKGWSFNPQKFDVE